MTVDEILSVPRKASSYPDFKKETIEYLKSKFPQTAKVLDIGVGCGIYQLLLCDYFTYIDGVEAHYPIIKEFKLRDRYRKVFCCDIIDFRFKKGEYDILIMGDVLEHIPLFIAQDVVSMFSNRCEEMIVAVPYLLPQPEEGKNKFAKHEQDDLTPEVMLERYPELKPMFTNERMGVYVKRECSST
jgi:hypothetical protein